MFEPVNSEELQSGNYRRLLFPLKKHTFWKETIDRLWEINEIRIRVNKPISIYMGGREKSMDAYGRIRDMGTDCKCFTYQELQELVDHWCQDSRYAFQSEIRRGFITVRGGHRIGICGETVMDEKGEIQTIKYIASVNLRIAHEVKGISDEIMPYIRQDGRIKNVLILSPPGAGKTTLLRDIIRNLSEGNRYHAGQSIGVVDERKEIAACYQGMAQLDLGQRTDILDGCPKAYGMKMLLRSMSPGAIAVDELGEREELSLIKEMAGSGCSIIATLHASGWEELQEKKEFAEIFEKKLFDIFIELYKKEGMYHMRLYKAGECRPCYES